MCTYLHTRIIMHRRKIFNVLMTLVGVWGPSIHTQLPFLNSHLYLITALCFGTIRYKVLPYLHACPCREETYRPYSYILMNIMHVMVIVYYYIRIRLYTLQWEPR